MIEMLTSSLIPQRKRKSWLYQHMKGRIQVSSNVHPERKPTPMFFVLVAEMAALPSASLAHVVRPALP